MLESIFLFMDFTCVRWGGGILGGLTSQSLPPSYPIPPRIFWFSELMVEFMERATILLLADAPAPKMMLQQFKENPPSAKDIGRVAGAYQHHAL